MATPGWWVLIGAGGTRQAEDGQAEDGQAEPAGPQHSAGTGMMSAEVSPPATVINVRTDSGTASTDTGGSASRTTDPEVHNFAHFCELVHGLQVQGGRLRRHRFLQFDWLKTGAGLERKSYWLMCPQCILGVRFSFLIGMPKSLVYRNLCLNFNDTRNFLDQCVFVLHFLESNI